jgi:hypothetical protein
MVAKIIPTHIDEFIIGTICSGWWGFLVLVLVSLKYYPISYKKY